MKQSLANCHSFGEKMQTAKLRGFLLNFLLTLLAFIPKDLMTYTARNRFLYEEVAESIRNPFWLTQHTLYDGISSNVGWYGLLAGVYSVFGFSLVYGKILRLALHLVSLFCLVKVLRRFLSWPHTLLPLFTISLSPTLLYLTTQQTAHGIDLQWSIICLWIALAIDFRRPKKAILFHFILGGITLFASMCYPALLFYWPAIFIYLMWTHWKTLKTSPDYKYQILSLVLAAAAAISVPIGASLYLKDPSFLFFDPHTNSGLFRGGGHNLQFDWQTLSAGLKQVLSDFFVKGDSYYFDLNSPEFSNFLGVFGFLFVIASSFLVFWKLPKFRMPVAIASVLFLLALVIPNFSASYPGLRRCTGSLVAFYGLFSLSWVAVTRVQTEYWKKLPAYFAFGILLVHHLSVLPSIYAQLKSDAAQSREPWLAIAATPNESLNLWKLAIKEGKSISCDSRKESFGIQCRLGDLYGAIAADQLWNEHRTPTVPAIDPITGKKIFLETRYWEDYYFEH